MSRRLALPLVLAALLTSTLFTAGPAFAAGEAQYRIGIVDFDNQSPYGGGALGKGCADMLATSLVKTGKFRVFERDKLDAVIREQDLGATGRMTPQSAAKVGKLLGLQAIVTGAVTEFGEAQKGGGGMGVNFSKTTYRAGVDIRLVDATTGEIIYAGHENSTWGTMKGSVFGVGGGTEYNEQVATQVLREAIEKFTATITEKMASFTPAPSAKKILKVEGDKIYVNAGSVEAKVGDTFGVYRPGEELIDPDTGESLGAEETKIGTLTVVEVKEKFCIAKATEGKGFAQGDVVK